MKKVNEIVQKLLKLPDDQIEKFGKILSSECNIIEDAYEPLEDSDIIMMYRKLDGTPYERDIWETILFRYCCPLTEQIAVQLIQKNIGVCELGHRRQTNRIQFMLADLIDEALIILGEEYYCSSSYSSDNFREFISKYAQNDTLLRHLTFKIPDDEKKETIISECIIFHDKSDELSANLKNQKIAKKLLQTDDKEFIQAKFEERQPLFWKSISSNIHTPEVILKHLSEISHVKYAKEIRHMATMMLKQQKRLK
jgi:hypothetical protein